METGVSLAVPLVRNLLQEAQTMHSFSFVRTGLTALTASIALLVAACGGSSSAPTTPSSASAGDTATGDPSCPVAVPGTSVTVEDTDTGAALVFVTTGDVADLRKRVAAMGSMHNDHHGKMGPLPTGAEAGGHDHSGHAGHGGGGEGGGGEHAGMDHGEHAGHAGGMISVHSKAEPSDVDGGAKLVFVAGGADVAKLQSELRMHAQHLASGTCSMGSH
jgi:hypothetical protein